MIVIAIYHFTVDQIKRSEGQSAMASAAYRSGEKLYSEYYGEVSDYTRKGGVISTEILLPDHAPKEYADRQTLWNAVEKVEKNKKAQLAYSFEIAFQNEFSLDENIALARQFLLDEFVSKGMIVDFCVHEPDREPGGIPNPHFHFMCPMRPLKENGKWDAKQHRQYLFDEQGNPILDDKGKQKFNAVPTTDWGSPETLEYWRKAWADRCNEKFAEKGLDIRVDHRSYERQGIDQIPTVHEGPNVRQMEKKGIATEKGNLNRFIRATNRMIGTVSKQLLQLVNWIKELTEQISQPQEVTVAGLLNRYYDNRNAGAWSRKAKIQNLKSHAEVIAYLDAHGITTLDDLAVVIDATYQKSDELKAAMKTKSDRMKDIQELLRMVQFYKDGKPVSDKLATIKFKKSREKFESEHSDELKKFRMAQRKLKPHFTQDGKLPITRWNKELAQLDQDYQSDQAQYSTVYHDSHTLGQIKYAVNQAMEHNDAQRIKEKKQEQDVSL